MVKTYNFVLKFIHIIRVMAFQLMPLISDLTDLDTVVQANMAHIQLGNCKVDVRYKFLLQFCKKDRCIFIYKVQ